MLDFGATLSYPENELAICIANLSALSPRIESPAIPNLALNRERDVRLPGGEPVPAGDVAVAEAFKAAMRQFAASPCVITTAHQGARRGLTATSVCSVSVDPPTLIACVNRSADACPYLEASGALCVSVLSESQKHVAERFAGALGHKGEARFEGLEWDAGPSGAPALRGALSTIDCRIEQAIPQGTHLILICRVLAATLTVGGSPLVYSDRQFWALQPL